MDKQHSEQNRVSWNAVTAAHNSHKLDQAKFLREGGSTLYPEELSRLMPLEGQRLLHLQCNCGQDTLSLAAQGAQATGVDISDDAIAFAKQLSEASGISASFERQEIHAWMEDAKTQGKRFERIFSSYGAIPWLQDLGPWAQGIAGILAPGGRMVLVEFHPSLWTFDPQGQPDSSYFNIGPERLDEGVTDYVATSGESLTPSGSCEGVRDFQNPEPCVVFQHTLGEVVTALARAGLRIEELTEFPHCNGYAPSPLYEQIKPRVYQPGKTLPSHACMFAVVATR